MLCVLDRIRIWKCWFLRRGENRSTRRKMFRSKGENQQQTENCTCLRLVRGLSPVLIALFRWPFHQSTESKEAKILITFLLYNMIFPLDQLRSLPVAWPLMCVTCEYLHQRSKLKSFFFFNCFNGFVKSYTWTANENGAGVTKTVTTSKTQTSGSARFPSVFWELRNGWCDGRISCSTRLLKKKIRSDRDSSIFSFLQMKHSLHIHSLHWKGVTLNRWGFKSLLSVPSF